MNLSSNVYIHTVISAIVMILTWFITSSPAATITLGAIAKYILGLISNSSQGLTATGSIK